MNPSTALRQILFTAAFVLLSALPAPAQSPPGTALLIGGGYADHGGQLVPSWHVGGRKLLVSLDSASLDPGTRRPSLMHRLDLHADAQYQHSSGEARCEVIQQQGCWRTQHTISGGVTSIWAVTPERHAVQLYLLPAGAGVHIDVRHMLRREPPTETAPFGEYSPGERRVSAGLGISHGIGLLGRFGSHTAFAEVRTILIRYADGLTGGGIPVSLGFAF